MLSGIGRLAVVAALAGAGLLAAAAGASAAPAAARVAPAALVFDINGSWTDNGSAKPFVSVSGTSVVVDMSYAHRPSAVGSVTDATTIVVTFPDAGTFIGKLQATNAIVWNNGSVWRKVYTGPMVTDINGTWTDGVSAQRIVDIGGYLTVVFQNGRPNGIGFAVNSFTIQVSFPGDATYLGSVDAAGFIRWSNNTQWQHPIIF